MNVETQTYYVRQPIHDGDRETSTAKIKLFIPCTVQIINILCSSLEGCFVEHIDKPSLYRSLQGLL